MTGFDYFVLAVIAVSVLVSVVRGATRELISIASWVVSGYLALRYAHAVAAFLPEAISSPTVRLVVGFIAILVVGLLLFGLVALALAQLLERSGLSATDRMLGALVGFARAVVILVVLTLIAGMTPLPRERTWRNALFSPPLESLAILVRTYLPAALASRIRYD
jgi:membrane protein required for colicin V production